MSKRRRSNRQVMVPQVAQADLIKASVEQTLSIMGVTVPPGGRARAMQQTDLGLNDRVYGQATDQNTQFAPGYPPPDTPLADTSEPRTYAFRTGWNYPSLPGEGRPLDYQTMRDLANVYDLLRKGIEIRKDEITSLNLDIIARDPDKKKAKKIIEGQQDKINEIRDFFQYPDRRNSYQAWMRALLEEYFVTDTVSIWKWKDYGGKPVGYKVLDGTLIKPLIDINGNRPLPPNPAYQQYVYGVPRWRFTSDELMWRPRNTRVWTPYGFSPVEQFVLHINGALRFERWSVDYFTDGTIPEGVAEAPASWTKQQIQEFNAYWDSIMAGDTRALRKLKFVAAGFKFHQLKPFDFNMEFAHWLVSMTAAAVDVTPIELGFEPLHGGIGGRGVGEEQSTVLRRKSTRPLLKWLRDQIFNPIIWHDFGAPDLQASFKEEGEQEDELNKMTARDKAIRNGSVSIDQVIEEDGGEPVGIGRIFVFGNQILGEPDLIKLSREGVGAVALLGSANPVSGGNQASGVQGGMKVQGVPQLAPPKPIDVQEDIGVDQEAHEDTASGTLRDPTANLPDEYSAAFNPDYEAYQEGSKFLRFFRARRKEGSWRPFKSKVLGSQMVDVLNQLGSSTADENVVRSVLAVRG